MEPDDETAPALPSSRPRLLIVEDEPATRRYLRELLSTHYLVEEAGDGQTALEVVRRGSPPDLILSDVIMARVGGLELLRTLRADPATTLLPVLLITGDDDEETRTRGFEAGADDYINKPIRARELLARVRTHLELARLRQHEGHEHLLAVGGQAADAARGRFLAALSHELRTPLAPVQMALFILRREPHLSEAAREGLEMIGRNVELEARLIDDLLDFSRIVHGKMDLDFGTASLHDCVRQAVEACAGEMAEKRLEVTVALEAPRDAVRGDAARLQQVFWNLLKNARKFTPDKGRVAIRSRGAEDSIIVEVADTGIGIEAAMLPRLFDAFEQGTPEITRLYGGLGLGLSISLAIVESHGGRLTAASSGPNRGTIFTVEMPLLDAAATGRGSAGQS